MATCTWITQIVLVLAALEYIGEALKCSADCDYDEATRYANCTSLGISCIPGNYPDADVMDLRYNMIENITANDFSGLRTVRVLYLDDNKIGGEKVIDPLLFSQLNEIEVLSLKNNRFTKIQVLYFNQPKLSSVFLDKNELNLVDPFLSDAIELLSLDNNQLKNVEFSDSLYQTLQSISMRNNDMETLDVEFFKGFSARKPMRLNVDHNSLTSIEIFFYRPSSLDLSLNYNKQNPTLIEMSGFPYNSIILTLRMNNIGLMNLDSLSIAFSRETTLFVSHNRLRNLTMTPGSARSITYLTVDYNLMEVITGKTFIDMSRLVDLSLVYNAIHTVSSEAFDNLDNLEYLDLRGNRITDVMFLDKLLASFSFQELEIGNNPLVCNQSICSLHAWLKNHDPYHPTTCTFPGESRKITLPGILNKTAAGCQEISFTPTYPQVGKSLTPTSPQVGKSLMPSSPYIGKSVPTPGALPGATTTISVGRSPMVTESTSLFPVTAIAVVITIVVIALIEGIIFVIYLKTCHKKPFKPEPQGDVGIAYQRNEEVHIADIAVEGKNEFRDLEKQDGETEEEATKITSQASDIASNA